MGIRIAEHACWLGMHLDGHLSWAEHACWPGRGRAGEAGSAEGTGPACRTRAGYVCIFRYWPGVQPIAFLNLRMKLGASK